MARFDRYVLTIDFRGEENIFRKFFTNFGEAEGYLEDEKRHRASYPDKPQITYWAIQGYSCNETSETFHGIVAGTWLYPDIPGTPEYDRRVALFA